MTQQTIDEITACMAIAGGDSSIQKIQTAHRLKLAEFWEIKAGDKILEIGCGQGDTTAVLAHLAGEAGRVHGIDIAPADYGMPITLGDAIGKLKQSRLGERIRVDFETDILSEKIEFREKEFDAIVLSHSSWYMQSADELEAVLKKLRGWGKKLCFAEWDMRVSRIDQYPHFLSVLIQAQYEAFKETSESNVRTLFTPDSLRPIAKQAGWTITAEESIDSPDLQDGEWEVQQLLADFEAKTEAFGRMPVKLKGLIESEMGLLKHALTSGPIKPLAAFAFIGE
ncbi:class I SAM-dependent methyltransferase [Planomicrobium sp. CPCC 101079]|uniref:class I SAM-dependent methyltransferase n=1 Tax=Planomicrobium sp. CPCC 101079 TaxID=2599618 RepID=UPI0011B7230A|nr:class I SAM-dependent methyltransferase [Planomicrobium sp. CPCC 101079]TWT01572.1 class I SAM-dependent methyltransferase [Planomicrobium sp. CPCC 101079]